VRDLFGRGAELVHVPCGHQRELGHHRAAEGLGELHAHVGARRGAIVRERPRTTACHDGHVAQAGLHCGGGFQHAAHAGGEQVMADAPRQRLLEVHGPVLGVARRSARAGPVDGSAVDIARREAGIRDGTLHGLDHEVLRRSPRELSRLLRLVDAGDRGAAVA
jgi:hypothetical protein